jgi:hypothetical protein
MSDERGKEYARLQMMEWAEGRRSYTNLGPEAPYTPDVIAIMDAQEVVKWATVYRALVGGDDG